MLFPRVLTQSEKQTASSRIWNHVANSIPYDDNRFSKSVSKNKYSTI